MLEPLRLLIIEDSPLDAELVLSELRRSGYEPQYQRVETAEAMRAALASNQWDIVLSDHMLPQFNSVAALKLLKESGLDLPFVIVSGTLGEEAAVDSMREGANDYLMKGNLARLRPVIDRELRQASQRRERRQTERALREAEEVFRALSVSSALGIFMSDGAGLYRYVNPHYRHLHGLSLMESTDDGWLNAVHPDDREALRQEWKDFVQSGGVRPFSPEYRLLTDTNQVRWMRKRAFPMRADTTELTGFVGTIEDITDRKSAEQQLLRSEQRFRDLFEHSPDAVFVEARDGRILDVNPAACRLQGFSREELLAKTVFDLVPPRMRPEIEREYPAWFDGRLQYLEAFAYRPNDETVPIEMRGVPIDYLGEPAILLHVHDLTDRRHLEAQLMQAQKMEAIGRLAGGVAHDFNNILTAITGFTDLTARKLEPNSPLRRNLDQVLRAAERATSLTRQLLAFSRKQTLQPKVLDLNTIVEDAHNMLRRLIGENIDLITRAAPDLQYVKADPGQIEQVIMNLAVNARDAMPNGGTLSIETANVTLDAETVRHRRELSAGNYVRLSMTDTGHGMSEEIQSHIFEPFFTTKPPGSGTGLGLATCYGIITQSGGDVVVQSEKDKGTTFTIYLPVVEQVLEHTGETVAKPVRGGTETILLVEDEPDVRTVANSALQHYGYTVWQAANGIEALERVRQPDADRIGLVVTDVIMPQMGGKELSDRLKDILPGVKVLFTSGYTENAFSEEGILQPGIEYLQKPYTPSSLAAKVREVLDAG